MQIYYNQNQQEILQIMNFSQILNTRNLLSNPLGQQDWPNLEKIVHHLQSYIDQCLKSRQYIEAQKAKQKIEEAYSEIKKRGLNEIEQKLHESLQQIDKSHSQQIKKFELTWQQKENKITQQLNQTLTIKIQKHKQEKEKYYNQLELALPKNHSPDNQLHKLRWEENQYVQQGRFIQAQKTKQKVQARQQFLQERHKNMRQNNIKLMMQELQQKHQNQIAIIEARFKQKFLQHQKQKKKKYKELQMKQIRQIKQIKWIYNQQMKKSVVSNQKNNNFSMTASRLSNSRMNNSRFK